MFKIMKEVSRHPCQVAQVSLKKEKEKKSAFVEAKTVQTFRGKFLSYAIEFGNALLCF
jgi:hypothetical protein